MPNTPVDNLEILISASSDDATASLEVLIKQVERMQAAMFNTTNATRKNSSATKTQNVTYKQLNTTLAKTHTHAKSLAHYFGLMYANLFLVVRGVKALWSSIENTADYVESFNYFTVAFSKIASEWDEDWDNYGSTAAQNYGNAFVTEVNDMFSKLSGIEVEILDEDTIRLQETGLKNLGLNIQEITQYASQLASVTNSLGQSGVVSTAIASSFTKLAGDISSLFNVDFSTVAKNLQSGLIGQSRALTYIAHKRSNVFKKTTLISGNSCESKTIRSQVLNWKGSTTIEMVA